MLKSKYERIMESVVIGAVQLCIVVACILGVIWLWKAVF